eukprot:gene3615-2553_t
MKHHAESRHADSSCFMTYLVSRLPPPPPLLSLFIHKHHTILHYTLCFIMTTGDTSALMDAQSKIRTLRVFRGASPAGGLSRSKRGEAAAVGQ